MDPYGHNLHTTHHRREEPPPPPPPHVSHIAGPPHHPPAPAPAPYVAEHHHHAAPPPPQPTVHHHSAPPPPQPTVHHVFHESSHHTPPIIDHHKKEPVKYTDNKPTVRFYSKAKTDYSLTIRDGKVILAPSNPADPRQHWVKDLTFSTKVKDEEGFPSFALVNKATGQAMKHSIGATQPVQLTEYKPNKLDESVLWTESKDLGDGYHAVRMVNNIRLNVDAFNGDKEHGGVHDGTTIVLWEWKKGDNQRWTTAPY